MAGPDVAFTDYYGQQSCTAGRAAFIMGQNPIRTGLTKVGMPGAWRQIRLHIDGFAHAALVARRPRPLGRDAPRDPKPLQSWSEPSESCTYNEFYIAVTDSLTYKAVRLVCACRNMARPNTAFLPITTVCKSYCIDPVFHRA
jgi:hypothetical protein